MTWKLLQGEVPRKSEPKPTADSLSEKPPEPLRRQFLLIDALKAPATIWIDDENTCHLQIPWEDRTIPVCRGGLHHLYYGPTGRKWAMRCPVSLSSDEKARIFDDSVPGRGREQARLYISTLREEASRGRRHDG